VGLSFIYFLNTSAGLSLNVSGGVGYLGCPVAGAVQRENDLTPWAVSHSLTFTTEGHCSRVEVSAGWPLNRFRIILLVLDIVVLV